MATQKVKPDPSIMERSDRLRHRRQTYGKVGTYTLVAIVFAVVAAAAFALWSSDRSSDQATVGQPSASVPTVTAPTEPPDTETAPPVAYEKVDYILDLKTGESTPLPKRIRGRGQNGYAISPDGSEVAYSGPAEDGGRGRAVFVARLDGRHVRQITHDAWAEQPAWSPDGTTIAYVGRPTRHATSNIFVVDLKSGVTTQVTFETGGVSSTEPNVRPTGIQFSPDASSIVYTANHPHHAEVRIMPVTGGNGRRLVGGLGSSASGASLLPDGSLLSYICDGDLCLAKADGSNPRLIVPGPTPFGINSASWSPDGSRLAYMDYGPEMVEVIDVTSGETTRVASGAWPRWVDDRTLVVEVCNCPH